MTRATTATAKTRATHKPAHRRYDDARLDGGHLSLWNIVPFAPENVAQCHLSADSGLTTCFSWRASLRSEPKKTYSSNQEFKCKIIYSPRRQIAASEKQDDRDVV